MRLQRLVRTDAGTVSAADFPDEAAVEAPLTLRVEGQSVAVVMRTPGHDRELAAGFLLTEGVIRHRLDVFEISLCPSLAGSGGGSEDFGGGSVDVVLADPAAWDPARLTRHVFTSSSCGVCGKTDLTQFLTAGHRLNPKDGPFITADSLFPLPARLREAQPAFEATGGLHGCAWFPLEEGEDRDGKTFKNTTAAPELVFEDVGRHNALDKLIGSALLSDKLPLAQGVLLLSGRVSFELIQKASAAGISIVAAIGAPSSLAIACAEAAGVTLCGFLKEGRLNLYTCPERLRL
ncbi:MAG: formate dehydrogenase [Verrucomicrobiales bacterium]|nr:formate dehydrogenase [Verrucomicrobiales bacterium]